jgi:hypothetical protein
MQQIVNALSEQSAYKFDFFPYCFGEFSKITYWVETHKKYGQRFCYRVRDPHRGVWTKEKASKYTDLVFMFQRNTGLIMEQCIDLELLSVEDILHIVEQYVVSREQKEIIQNYIAKSRIPMRTVWRAENTGYDVDPLNYDITQVTRRAKPPVVKSSESTDPEQDEIEKLRLKLHDPEARDLNNAQRAFYYDTMNKKNPDEYSNFTVKALS